MLSTEKYRRTTLSLMSCDRHQRSGILPIFLEVLVTKNLDGFYFMKLIFSCADCELTNLSVL